MVVAKAVRPVNSVKNGVPYTQVVVEAVLIATGVMKLAMAAMVAVEMVLILQPTLSLEEQIQVAAAAAAGNNLKAVAAATVVAALLLSVTCGHNF